MCIFLYYSVQASHLFAFHFEAAVGAVATEQPVTKRATAVYCLIVQIVRRLGFNKARLM